MKHFNTFSATGLFSTLLFSCFSGQTLGQTINEKIVEEILKEKTRGVQIGMDEAPTKGDERSTFSEIGAEPFIAIDPNDPLRMGISFMGTTGNWQLFLSDDGGTTWDASALSTIDQLNAMYPDDNIIGGGDPVFTFGNDGSLHVSWIYLHGTDLADPFNNTMECFYTVSNDFGATWEARPSIHAGLLSSYDVIDRIWIDTDHSGGPGHENIYLSAVHLSNSAIGPAGQLVFKKPADSSQYNIEGVPGILPGPGQTQYGNLLVDDNGNIHMTAAIIGAGTEEVTYARSTDAGESFSQQFIASGNLSASPSEVQIHARENCAISLAVDDDNVYIAWADLSEGSVQCYYVYSHDNGATFSDPIEFAAEINEDLYAATMPCVAADNGYMVLSWYLFDKETKRTRYLSAYSTDAGVSLSAYQTLSEETTDFNSEPSTQFYGDYNDAAMEGCQAHFTWCDGRTGGPRVYHSAVDACTIGAGEVSITEHTPVTDLIQIGQIMPNPVNTTLALPIELTTNQNMQLEIYDVEGRLVWQQPSRAFNTGSHLIEVPVASLKPGTYLLKGQTDTEYFFTRRWIKA